MAPEQARELKAGDRVRVIDGGAIVGRRAPAKIPMAQGQVLTVHRIAANGWSLSVREHVGLWASARFERA